MDRKRARLRICSRVGIAVFLLGALAPLAAAEEFPIPRIPYAPRAYLCQWTAAPPLIDGQLQEPAWRSAPWSEPFVDIEGPLQPLPPLQTRVKMLWDDSGFYIAADLEEPDLWATYEEHDSVIFHENDFEVFIDPDGDTHEYYEFEINARNTGWDLLLIRPYRDGGPAVNGWEIPGLRTAVALRGSLNDPTDVDHGWTVELFFPWKALAECAHRPAPPAEGDRWRVNFSRVEWDREVQDSSYVKSLDPATGRPLPEHNWVWSPQGLINMHYPEMWGEVAFTRTGTMPPLDPDAAAAWSLRLVYYAERIHQAATGTYAAAVGGLSLDPALPPGLRLQADLYGFTTSLTAADGRTVLVLTEDGRLRRIPKFVAR